MGVMLGVMLSLRTGLQSWVLGPSGNHGFCLFLAQR